MLCPQMVALFGKVVEHSEVDLSRGSGSLEKALRFSSLALLPVHAVLPDCRCNVTSQLPALATMSSLPQWSVQK